MNLGVEPSGHWLPAQDFAEGAEKCFFFLSFLFFFFGFVFMRKELMVIFCWAQE